MAGRLPPERSGGAPASIEIVIPARNEAHRLPDGLASLCRKAAALPLRAAILVVDSASSDLTADVVRGWPAGPVPVTLLRCDRPGKGLAVRAGLLATRAPFVGFCDADMATDLAALDVAVSLLVAGWPMIIGSRALAASDVEDRHNGFRRAGAAGFRALARRIVPEVTDTQCGFKFFSGPLARAAALSMRTAGFAFDVELIAHCKRLGATLTEVPVCWRDVPGSTFSVVRHSAATSRDVAAIWLRLRRAQAVARAQSVPGTRSVARGQASTRSQLATRIQPGAWGQTSGRDRAAAPDQAAAPGQAGGRGQAAGRPVVEPLFPAARGEFRGGPPEPPGLQPVAAGA